MSPAVTVRGPLTLIRTVSVRGTCSFTGTFFRFRMMSVTSSITPESEENSWRTPSILIAVIAAPSTEESRIRRSALPIVVPKPRS